MKRHIALIISLVVMLGIFLVDHSADKRMFEDFSELTKGDVLLGADATKFVGGKVYTIAGTGLSSSGTSMTLTSFTDRSGNVALQMSNHFGDIGYLTIEPTNPSKTEFVSFTGITGNADGSATITGITRGLEFVAPYTASTTLQQSHAGGSRVIISDPPQLFDRVAVKSNDESIVGQWDFNTVLPTSSLTATTSTQFTTKSYVDSVSNQGAATSTETNGGIVELATALEMASSSDDGTGNKPLALYAKHASSSPDLTNTGPLAIISKINRKLDQSWFDLSEAFTWTGAHTFNNATTSISQLNITSSIDATSATVIEGLSRVATSTLFTASSTWTKPAGAEFVEIYVVGGGGGGGSGRAEGASCGSNTADGGGGGGGGAVAYKRVDADALTSSETVTVGAGGSGGAGVLDSNNGNAGSAGGTSSFGDTTIVAATGGAGGGAGASGGGSGGSGASAGFGDWVVTGGNGGAGGDSTSGSQGIDTAAVISPRGGGGGGACTSDADGGAGGAFITYYTNAGGAGGTGDVQDNGDNGNAVSFMNLIIGGTGAGGGEGEVGGPVGGDGGTGGNYGAGGGGGGAVATVGGPTSGAGGTGAGGAVLVITYF